MIKHHLKMAFRAMARQKTYTAIKIGGFAIGIAACLLIALLVKNELSYDSHYKDAASIFRVVGSVDNNGKIEKGVSWPAPLAKACANDFPEIEKAGRLMPGNLFYGAGSNQLKKAGDVNNTYEEGFCYADQEMLDILQLPMAYGERATALKEPNTLVMTKRKADKYFPGQNPVGKVMYLNDDKTRPFTIGGVMENWPTTSHLQYDFFLTLSGVAFWDGEQTTWSASNYSTYVQLIAGTNVKQFEKKVTSTILDKYVLPTAKKDSDLRTLQLLGSAKILLQPIKDIHLKSYDMWDWETRGDIRFVWMFAAIAIFILIIACINFLNLSTARSANRAKEVGVRKVIGSRQGNLVWQFLTESLLYSFLSFVIGFLLAWLLLPYFNHISAKSLAIPWKEWSLFPLLVGAAIIIGLVAGLYPSFYLSAFKPISVLKGQLARGSRNATLRSTLVVFQFTTSIVLLIGTFVIYRQMQYITTTKIGFDKDEVLLIQGANTLKDRAATFKNELLKLQQVKTASLSGYLPVTGTKRDGNTFWKEGKTTEEPGVGGQKWVVDDSYIETLGMKIIAGRNFLQTMRTDSQAVIINKTMADKIAYKEPIGKIITNGWQHFTIIGIVEDFKFESMKEQVEPLCLMLGNSNDIVSVKVNAADLQQAIASITSLWKSFAPHQPFRYVFLDEQFASMYADVQRTGAIFTSFSILAMIVACLGLFGLAAFMAEQRSKEISIRKVLGATVSGLFRLLTGNFLKLVLISLVIAVPLGWFLMNEWLQDYAYRTSITWEVFVLSGLVVILVALATICYQAIRAAIANPIKSLRTE